MAAGVFGYLGYDMVRQMEHLPNVPPDPLGLADALFIRPTVVLVFDAVKDQITVVTPVRPQPGQGAKQAYDQAVNRLGAVIDALDGPLERQTPLPDHAWRSWPAWSPTRAGGGLFRHGRPGEGLHRRRRHLPGGAVPALLHALHPAALLALPGAAARQSLALPLLSRLRRLLGRRLLAGDPGAGARRQASPSAPSPAPARAARRRPRTSASATTCSPIRRSAPST
jgi:hypothetical protein